MKTKILRRYPFEIFAYAVSSLLALSLPVLLGYLIDTVIIGERYAQLGGWAALALTLTLLSSLSTFYFIRYIPVRKGIENSIALQQNALRNVLKMTVPSFERKDKGYYYNVVMNSASSYGDIHEELHLRLLGNLFCIAAVLVFIWQTNFVFGLIFLAYVPLVALFSFSRGRALFHMQKDAMELQDGWLGSSKNIIESKREINALQADDFFLKLFARGGKRWLAYILKYRFHQNLVEYIPAFLNNVYGILFLIVGARMAHQDLVTAGALIAGYQYLNYLSSPVAESVNILIRYAAGREHVVRVDGLEELSSVPKEIAALPRSETKLFAAERFAYRKGAEKSDLLYEIRDLSLELGKFYIVKGANGSGKSMLLNLMMGNTTLTHSEGTFVLGRDAEFAAYLTYPLFFVEGSFEENLFNRRYDPELLDILNIDFADRQITSNPVNLSFGQQQKIALLRVFSMDRPILFLDEPFSNLDESTRTRLIQYLSKMKRQKTIICIMHDDSLDAVSDAILRVADKRLELESDNFRNPFPSPSV